ncbi:hypothetical protein GGI42DRAFT_331607 [Trichoderma sp. SZMC 28013]
MSHEPQATVQRSIIRTESPPTSVMVQERVIITREDAVAAVGGMIDTFNKSAWDDNQNNKLKETLTEQMIMVLPPEIKEDLIVWANMTGFLHVKDWVKRATEDKQQHSWIEMRENPLLWSRRGPAAILDEMKQVMNVEGVHEAARRRKMDLLIDQMKFYIP